MLSSIIYFLPCVVSVLWLFSFMLKQKGERQKLFTWIMAITAFYFATYAIYISPNTNYQIMVKMDVLCLPIIPTLMAMYLVYFYMHHTSTKLSLVHGLLLIPSIVIGSISSMLYYILGFDKTAQLIELADKGLPIPAEYDSQIFRLWNFFSEPFVNIVVLIYIILLIFQFITIERKGGYRWGDICRFLFRGKATTPSRAISFLYIVLFLLLFPMTVFGRRFMIQNEEISFIITILIAFLQHIICYIEFYSETFCTMTLYELSHLRIGSRLEVKDVMPETIDAEDEDKTILSKRQTVAIEKLRHLMEVEKVYTNENMSSSVMAEMLGVGHSTFSTMVIATYGVTFRELLNQYRVEHAKKYMLANPTATQEVVAIECGFKNAQYLNFKFKSIVGDTPSIWLKKQNEDRSSQI